MKEDSKEVELSVSVDEYVIATIKKITQESIIATAKNIKKTLLEHNIENEKVLSVYEATIEILQNILKYAYGRKIDENKTREADGEFSLTYNRMKNEITLSATNLITTSQQKLIEQRINEIKDLNEKELRKYIREKLRSRRHIHADGSGFGFATIIAKAKNTPDITFEPLFGNVVKYSLKLVI